MVQDQLVEYINSQIKAGVSADVIKSTLVTAGWQTADVDDTMKKVQAPQVATVSMAAAAATMPAQPKAALPSFSINSFNGAQKAEPQVIKVSDLVSNAGVAKSAAPAMQVAQPMQISSAKTDAIMARIATGASGTGTTGGVMSGINTAGPKKSHALETETILGVLMVLFGAAAIFFFFENRSLSGQFAALNTTSGGVSSDVAALQAQLDASTTALSAQLSSATTVGDALALELSFLAVMPGTTPTTTFTTALTGMITGGTKISYVITTAHGVKVYVTNSKDARVIALLQPLIGTTPVEVAGNYVPGADTITITAVNGVSVTPPPVAATSTPTSTPTGTTGGLMIPATTTTP